MADVHNTETRSKNMKAVKNSDTAIEKVVAAVFDSLEINYKAQPVILRGKPDFLLADYQTVVFVHGCFWHKHSCHLFKIPSTRTEFWLDKINSNVTRDRIYIQRLFDDKWRILVIWECAIRGRLKLPSIELQERIEEWLCGSDSFYSEIDSYGIKNLVLTK